MLHHEQYSNIFVASLLGYMVSQLDVMQVSLMQVQSSGAMTRSSGVGIAEYQI